MRWNKNLVLQSKNWGKRKNKGREGAEPQTREKCENAVVGKRRDGRDGRSSRCQPMFGSTTTDETVYTRGKKRGGGEVPFHCDPIPRGAPQSMLPVKVLSLSLCWLKWWWWCVHSPDCMTKNFFVFFFFPFSPPPSQIFRVRILRGAEKLRLSGCV